MSDFTERQWAQGGRLARARANAVRAPLRAAVRAAAERGLAGVPFASATAEYLAREAGLAWPRFSHASPSSVNGFTAADVRQIINAGGA